MKHEKYNVSGLNEMCHYLRELRDETDWRIDFYNVYDALLMSFISDDETLHILKDEDDTYQMVTESMDIALMMGNEL